MKKIIIFILITLIFIPSSFIFAATYTYVKHSEKGVKDEIFSSIEDCNKNRDLYIKTPEYNDQYLDASTCKEVKDSDVPYVNGVVENIPRILKLESTSKLDPTTDQWIWTFINETQYVGSGTEFLFSLLDKNKSGGDAVIGTDRKVKSDNENITKNIFRVPKENKVYIMETKISAPYCDTTIDHSKATLRSLIECNAMNGVCSNIDLTNQKYPTCIEEEDDAIPVTPKIGATENNNIYKMLVPLPGITCMDNTGENKECIGNNIGKYLNLIFKFGIGLCAALAVVMLIIYGVVYMGDESIFAKTEAKKKMFGAITGLIIAIGGWALLNTINPDLTGKNGLAIDSVNVILKENLVFFNAKNVAGLSYGDDLFLGYMAHQQGAGGIKAIIAAAQNNTSVSDSTMTNMRSNFPIDDAQNTIGTSEITPTNFLLYWSKKLAAAKQSTVTVYSEVDTALSKASQDTGVDKSILVAMCRIESLKHCSAKESISSTNGSYSGLFQLGSDVWNKYKKSTDSDIFDPYANARVAALYFKDNLKIVKS